LGDESDEDSSTLSTSSQLKSPKQPEDVRDQAAQTQERVKQAELRKKSSEREGNFSPRSSVTSQDIELVENSWRALVDLRDKQSYDVGALGRFSEHLLAELIHTDSHFATLFGKTPLLEQRSFVKTLALIAQVAPKIDSELALETLRGQGARHDIYGVDKYDYEVFTEATVALLEEFLGKEIITAAVKQAWVNIIEAQRRVMHYRPPDFDLFSGVVLRPSRSRMQKWKPALLRIDINYMFLYEDEKGNKIKTSHPLRECKDVREDGPMSDGYHTFLISTIGPPNSFSFGAPEKECLKWVAEFKWRIEAFRRRQK